MFRVVVGDKSANLLSLKELIPLSFKMVLRVLINLPCVGCEE